MGFSNFTKITVTPNPTDLTSCKVQTTQHTQWDMNAGQKIKLNSDLGNSGLNSHLVQDHGLVGKVHQRLGHTQCQWPQPGAEPSDQNQSLHGASGKCSPSKPQQSKAKQAPMEG